MQTPDYSKYSLPELLEVRQNIDTDAHPERVQLINQQIEIKQAHEANPLATQSTQNMWKRRFTGFLFDCIFAFGPFVVLDNLLTYPINNLWLIIVSMLWFSGYFTYYEVLKNQSTLGKQRYNLKIESNTSNSKLSLLRILIVTMLFFFNDVATLAQQIPIPYVFVVVLSILASALLYNIYLAIKAPSGVMLQDALTSSVVLDIDDSRNNSVITLHKPWLWPTLFIVFTVGYLYLLPSGTETQDPAGVYLEKSVAEKLNTRARITVAEKEIWRTGQDGSVRALEIHIWVPFAGWNDDNLNRISETVLDMLTITPGFYNEGSLTVETGWGFKLSNTYVLNMPQAEETE